MLFNTKNLSYMFTETNLVTNQRLNNLCSLFNPTKLQEYPSTWLYVTLFCLIIISGLT